MTSQKTKEKRREYAKIIAGHTKRSWIRYYLDETYCHYMHGASPENYFVLRFFFLSEDERNTYLTSGRSKEVDSYLNRNACEKDKKIIWNKQVFNQVFDDWNQREFLYAPNRTEEEIVQFIERQKTIFVKPVGLTQGQGIRKVSFDLTESDLQESNASLLHSKSVRKFAKEAKEKKYLLEEVIRQHPAIEQIHKESVNTIRIIAARNVRAVNNKSIDSKLEQMHSPIIMVGAALRCGCQNAVVDNFHQGGVAYPVNLNTGKISGPGRDNTTLYEYGRHPGSNVDMCELTIPFWRCALQAVEYGMEKVPTLGYVGWDLAITNTGVEIIEGNYNWPGGNIIQLDKKGKYPLVKCLKKE